MNFFKNLKRYLHQWVIYLHTIAHAAWGVILPIALLLVIKFLPWESNNLVRYAGLLLEILGLYTVIEGHLGKRKLFNRPTFLANTKALIAQYPRWKTVTQTIFASGMSSSGSFGSARLSAWHEARDESIEAKLEAIEKNLLSIRSQLETFEQDTIKKHSDLTQKFEVTQQRIDSSISDIRTKLESLAVKDIGFEGLGIYWLFCGLFFSSLSIELAKLLSWL